MLGASGGSARACVSCQTSNLSLEAARLPRRSADRQAGGEAGRPGPVTPRPTRGSDGRGRERLGGEAVALPSRFCFSAKALHRRTPSSPSGFPSTPHPSPSSLPLRPTS